MNLIADGQQLDDYFAEHQVDAAKIRPASEWTEAVIDRFYGEGAEANWTRTGFTKTDGKFELRPGELTIWAGINGHGKTTYLSHIMLNVMQASHRVCLASMEMKPADSVAKMARQAAGTATPSHAFIRAFTKWTNERLWLYDHLGRVATSRMLAVATYVAKELKAQHLVIDSLMKCGIGVDDYTGQKDFVDALCAIARDTGMSIHLVCHMRKGENERMAPGKFDVKGAGEIADLADNVVIVWKNVRKPDKPDEEATSAEADAFVRVAKQRHHSWEGSFAFWFDRGSQQFLEYERERPRYLDIL